VTPESQSVPVSLDPRPRCVGGLQDLSQRFASDRSQQHPHPSDEVAEATGRDLFQAEFLDHPTKFLFELAGNAPDQFTVGGRGARLVAAGKYICGLHLQRYDPLRDRSQNSARIEICTLDDYGPLQATHPGTRYVGGTGSINFGESCDGILKAIKPYVLIGTGDGDLDNDDTWVGIDALGTAPADIQWNAEWANRFVDAGKDRMAWRVSAVKQVALFDGVLDSISLQHSDANGKMDVGNPADFNSAGLLHQYGGAWRSDMQTNQLGIKFMPGLDIDLNVNLLTLDRRGTSSQLGDYEGDVIIGRKFASGIYASAGYGIDNDIRQVGFVQITLNF